MTGRAHFALALGCLSLACNGAGGAAGSADLPAACQSRPTPSDWTYPPGPYGAQLGDRLEELELDDCDGNRVRLGDVLSEAELVLFNVGAGWCQPCIDETKVIEEELYAPFCARGLRIVQVLFQDEQSRPASKTFCADWRDEFGLQFSVLVDPLFTTSTFFEDAGTQTPLNLLVDRDATIVFRAVGTVPVGLDQQIDMRLPPP